jgi:hypothetical protein
MARWTPGAGAKPAKRSLGQNFDANIARKIVDPWTFNPAIMF